MLRTFFCQVCKESMKKDALFHPSFPGFDGLCLEATLTFRV